MSGLYKFDFYPRDWLTGTRELSPEARGIYIDLITLMYERGGALRFDEGDLRRMLGGIDVRPLRRIIGELVAKAKVETAGGMIFNQRVLDEIAKAQRRGVSAGRKDRDRLSAEQARAAQQRDEHDAGHAALRRQWDEDDSSAGSLPEVRQTSAEHSTEVRETSAELPAEVGRTIEPDQPLDFSAARALARAFSPSPSPSLEGEGEEEIAARARDPAAPQALPSAAVPNAALPAPAPTPEPRDAPLDAFFEIPGFLRRPVPGRVAAPVAAAGAAARTEGGHHARGHDAELRAGLAEAVERRAGAAAALEPG